MPLCLPHMAGSLPRKHSAVNVAASQFLLQGKLLFLFRQAISLNSSEWRSFLLKLLLLLTLLSQSSAGRFAGSFWQGQAV